MGYGGDFNLLEMFYSFLSQILCDHFLYLVDVVNGLEVGVVEECL